MLWNHQSFIIPIVTRLLSIVRNNKLSIFKHIPNDNNVLFQIHMGIQLIVLFETRYTYAEGARNKSEWCTLFQQLSKQG